MRGRPDTTIEGTPSHASLEGQILAHRKILGLLVALCHGSHGTQSERLLSLLQSDLFPMDHTEDPGSDPDSAFAVEAGLSEELRAIFQEASRWLEPGRVA